MDENRKKALSAALGQIEKQFGKGSVMRLGDAIAARDIEVVSTGSLGLDVALGVGGLPRGRIVEIYGPESSGKTTLTLQVVAEVQKLGGTAAFIDAEHALDPGYAQKVGVNVDDLLISQPDTGEQALEITDMLVRSGAVDVVVITGADPDFSAGADLKEEAALTPDRVQAFLAEQGMAGLLILVDQLAELDHATLELLRLALVTSDIPVVALACTADPDNPHRPAIFEAPLSVEVRLDPLTAVGVRLSERVGRIAI